jgi:C-terminal processing protease CtpA/Prc
MDYDYSKGYEGAGNYPLSVAGGTLGDHTRQTAADTALLPGYAGTIFSDSKTFDQAYEGVREKLLDIYAPAGKLGVVIDTPNDGPPIFQAVKDTSPIVDKVRVGDRLVAVDDEDVRGMTATEVSKLISRKSINISRKLTVIRMDAE